MTEMKTEPPSLLLLDDDATLRAVLGRILGREGYVVTEAEGVIAATLLAQNTRFDAAIIDLRLPGDSGLVAVRELKRLQPQLRIVVLTGFASIATAVDAIKLGAVDYLTKPVDAAAVLQALRGDGGDVQAAVPETPMSVDRLEWEHIQKTLNEHDGNISATARALNMHRRTLQRKLGKKPVAK